VINLDDRIARKVGHCTRAGRSLQIARGSSGCSTRVHSVHRSTGDAVAANNGTTLLIISLGRNNNDARLISIGWYYFDSFQMSLPSLARDLAILPCEAVVRAATRKSRS
jgi:hypothetical protein